MGDNSAFVAGRCRWLERGLGMYEGRLGDFEFQKSERGKLRVPKSMSCPVLVLVQVPERNKSGGAT